MSIRGQVWILLIFIMLVLRNPHKEAIKAVRNITHTEPGIIRAARHSSKVVTPSMIPNKDVLLPSPAVTIDENIPSFIRGTCLNNKSSVQQFLSHLSCFSASGEWTIDPKPPPSLCKVNTRPHPLCTTSTTPRAAWQVQQDSKRNLSWIWKTNASCPFVAYDRVKTCNLLASTGNILILGDSINYQIFVTFLNFLRADYSHVVYSDHGFGLEEICGDILPEGRKLTIGWVWNPFLRIDTTVPYLRKWNIKTLIFNTGAKFQEDAAYTWTIKNFVNFLQVRYSHVLVIFRNTPPGHINCLYFHEPIEKPQWKGDLIYHWGEFARQNELAKVTVQKAKYIYMDVDTMLGLRPDQHMQPPFDCLHYAIPGPLDVVFHLFYNILLLLH